MSEFPLLRFASALTVAHHVPGRIRLKLAAPLGAELMAAAAEAKAFGQTLSATPGIRAVDFNALARSCTIHYDPAAIPPAAWTGLLAGGGDPDSDALLRALASAAVS